MACPMPVRSKDHCEWQTLPGVCESRVRALYGMPRVEPVTSATRPSSLNSRSVALRSVLGSALRRVEA